MKKFLVILGLSAVFATAQAQFDFGGGSRSSSQSSSKPWADFKLPKKTMKLDFRNANVDMVLSLFTKTSGITIVKDPALTQPLTLTTAKAIPIGDAFEVLNAALSVRNFEMRKDGNLLVIRQRQQRQSGRGGMSGGLEGMSPEMMQGMMQGMSGGNTELKTYPIKFANATQVARMLNEVFASSGGGGFRMPFMGGGGRGGFNAFGRGGGGGFDLSSLLGGGPTIRASADEYSNTVIVNAPRTQHRQVEDLIKEIDKQTEDPLKPKVYKLTYAMASDLQPVVQNVLIANAPKGRGGTNQQQNNQPFSFFPFGGGQNRNNQQNSLVVAEERTNSLIVTTTEQNQGLVDQVIKELDTEVKLESTTFIFPLDNARADQVSQLLRQAFGNRSGTGGNFNNAGAGNRNNNTQNRNNNFGRQGGGGGGNNFGGGGGGQLNNGMEELLLDLPEGVDSGELLTNVAVQQGGIFGQLFGGGQNQQNRNNQNRVPMGRNANGQLVPVQDLTGQVTVIPDQNTNSLIVVTTPENAALIRAILAQLDKIPEQVMIETMIVEASLDANTKLGVEWKFTQDKAFGNTGTTGTAQSNFGTNQSTAQGFKYTLTGGVLDAFINALKTDTKFNVLSTPKIFTSNNVQAQINISQRVPFVVSQRTDANGNITYNYDFEDVGIVLTVTPRITANGYVTMDVSQTANDLQGFTSFNAPIVNQRQAETTVSVKDGETIILGGIIRNSVSSTVKKIPLLGDIPILGNLFKTTDKTNSKTELLVFLTPRLVRDSEDAKKMSEQEKLKLSKPTLDQINKAGGKTNGGGN